MDIDSIIQQLLHEHNQDNFTSTDYCNFDEYFAMNQQLTSTDIVNILQEAERKTI